MENAENGSLQNLIDRHAELYNMEPFPNRLLWRFFMCCRFSTLTMFGASIILYIIKLTTTRLLVIRGCIEMAYYNAEQDGNQVNVTTATLESLDNIAPGPLSHQDIQGGNIVVGAIMPDFQAPEHYLTPILKLIDFGEANEIDPNK